MSDSNKPIEQYMTRQTHTVRADATIHQAEALMREHKIHHLPVLDGGTLVGIVSDRDLATARNFEGVDPETLPVEEASTQEVYVALADTPIRECVRHMADKHVGCTVVSDKNDRVVGIFTTTDACRVLADII